MDMKIFMTFNRRVELAGNCIERRRDQVQF